MHSRPSRLRPLLVAAVLAWPGLAIAQTPAPTVVKPATSTSAPVPTQTSAQAQQALEVLRDPRRRAELITTLEAIAAAGAAPAATAAVPPAEPVPPPAEAASKLPIDPDSLGVQLIDQVSLALSNAGEQLMTSLHSVDDLPLLWRWMANQASDPDARARMLDAGWKLLVVLAAGLAAETGARLLLQRVRITLSRAAHQTSNAPLELQADLDADPSDDPAASDEAAGNWAARDRAASDRAASDQAASDQAASDWTVSLDEESGLAAAEAGELERSARDRRLTGALGALRRLPLLLGRLLLDLVPIALFAVVANLLLGTRLGMPAPSHGTILLVTRCYVVARLILSVTELLVSPSGSRMRLLQVSGWAADFLTRWVRRVTIISVTGYAIAGVGLQFEMYRTAYDALLKLFALVMHGFLVVAVLQARKPVARRIRARQGATGLKAALQNRLAETWHLVAIFYIVALWFVWAVELRNGYVRLIHFFLVTAAVSIVSRVIAIMLLGGLDRARILPHLATRIPGLEARANVYYPVLRSLLMTFIGMATAIALLEVWGIDFVGWLEGNGLGRRIVSAGLLIGFTVLLAVLVWEGVNSGIEAHLSRLSRSAQLARAGRLRTLLPMLRTVLLVTIVLFVTLMTLGELGVNIAPLLAGAGVVGIAVGFGSQKLVQDLITGLFLLLENTMQVGDVVTLGGLSGTVEALSIRTIRLRAIDGSVHIIPFSAVTTVTNQTRDYGYAVLDISVGLNEEPGHIVTVLKDVAETMRQEPRWQGIVLEPLDVMGVDKFVDMAWVMRVRLKTQPGSRWAVGRELNARIKVAFDEQAIESPFTSHRVLSTNPAAPMPADQALPADQAPTATTHA